MTNKELRVVRMLREADEIFVKSGGGTKHFVRECLHPMLEKHGLTIIDAKTLEKLLGANVATDSTGVIRDSE